MADAGLDAMLVFAPENIYYLTGYSTVGYYQYQHLLLPRDGQPTLLAQRCELGTLARTTWVEDTETWLHGENPVERTLQILQRHRLTTGVVGVEGDSWFLTSSTMSALRERCKGISFVDSSGLVAELRLQKSPAELGYVRQAAAIVDVGMKEALDATRIGSTEQEVMAAATFAMHRAGGEYPSLPMTVSSGERTVALNATPTQRPLARGDHLIIEVMAAVKRYNVNVLRTIFLGEPTRELRNAWEILVRAVQSATEAVRPGLAAAEIDAITRRVTAPLDHCRTHRSGGSMEASYPPGALGALSFAPSDPHTLRSGMVLAIEPTLVDIDHQWGMMLGHCVIVTENGCDILHKATSLDLLVKE